MLDYQHYCPQCICHGYLHFNISAVKPFEIEIEYTAMVLMLPRCMYYDLHIPCTCAHMPLSVIDYLSGWETCIYKEEQAEASNI